MDEAREGEKERREANGAEDCAGCGRVGWVCVSVADGNDVPCNSNYGESKEEEVTKYARPAMAKGEERNDGREEDVDG